MRINELRLSGISGGDPLGFRYAGATQPALVFCQLPEILLNLN